MPGKDELNVEATHSFLSSGPGGSLSYESTRRLVLEIDPTSEARMKIRCLDWERIKHSIAQLPEKRNVWRTVAATALGIAVEGVLASLPMWASPQPTALWIRSAFLVLTAASAGVALVAFIFSKQIASQFSTSVQSIIEDLEAIERTLPDYPIIQEALHQSHSS
jgi:hypothetical protein